MNRSVMDSPVGPLLFAAKDGRLCGVRLLAHGETTENAKDPVLMEAERQIRQYFAGLRRSFDLPLQMYGSEFDRAVWTKLLQIPFEEVCTYGQLACDLGKPKASRAVGGACARNPLLIVVPCHRVVAVHGKLTGFAAGLQAKRMLLEHEGWRIKEDCLVFRVE